jgi:multicomponent Na+:H+ antiporter subunit E
MMVLRMAGFLGLWLVIAGSSARDLPTGLTTAAAATWASLILLPSVTTRLRPIAMVRLFLRFLSQSVLAGMDVARRAFDPRLPLRPGFVLVPIRLAPGPARDMFSTLESLLPGTLPVGSNENGALIVHCLDTGQPVLPQMAADENLLIEALGLRGGHG